MVVNFILLILGAYLLGSVPAAYLAAKWSRGIDIRQYGSGNVGGANVFRFTSKKVACPVFVFDFAKGMVMVWVAQSLGLGIAQQVTVGLVVIVGHNWPIFLRFSGGRGMLTALGVAIILPSINGLIPWEMVVFLVVAGIIFFGFHNVPLGVTLAITTMPLVSWGFNRPLALTLGFLAIFLLMVIRRLTVPRNSLSATVTPRQLFINRLLFDRDIRDRLTWIDRMPPEEQKNDKKSEAEPDSRRSNSIPPSD